MVVIHSLSTTRTVWQANHLGLFVAKPESLRHWLQPHPPSKLVAAHIRLKVCSRTRHPQRIPAAVVAADP